MIIDTAGRLAVDEQMMAEISGLKKELKPAETLFVVDAMQGQDAVNTAKAFGDALPFISLYAIAGYRLMPAMQVIYASLTALIFVNYIHRFYYF